MSLKFEDLSTWDIGLIKSYAIDILVNTRETNRYVALTDSVLSCINSKGYNLSCTSNLLKDISKSLSDTSESNYSSDEIIYLIFEYLKSNNIVIIKDETREPTWSRVPKPLDYKPYYKPWMITWKN